MPYMSLGTNFEESKAFAANVLKVNSRLCLNIQGDEGATMSISMYATADQLRQVRDAIDMALKGGA